MNIFVTSKCPIESAQALDDKRVVKMVLESAQMLCTALNEITGKQIAPYKSTHKNHPCNVWLRHNYSNWEWLHDHFLALCSEYTKRYGKTHKCEGIIATIAPEANRIYGEVKYNMTPFPNCARNKSLNIDYTHIKDIHLAYQMYLNDRWDTDKRTPTWYKVKK